MLQHQICSVSTVIRNRQLNVPMILVNSDESSRCMLVGSCPRIISSARSDFLPHAISYHLNQLCSIRSSHGRRVPPSHHTPRLSQLPSPALPLLQLLATASTMLRVKHDTSEIRQPPVLVQAKGAVKLLMSSEMVDGTGVEAPVHAA